MSLSLTWSEFAAKLRRTGFVPCTVILDSWKRSRESGIDGDGPVLLRRILPEDLELRLAGNAAVLRAAEPFLENFSEALTVKHVLYLSDADGTVLYSLGDPLWMAMHGLFPGYDWSEATMAPTAPEPRWPRADPWRSSARNTICRRLPV